MESEIRRPTAKQLRFLRELALSRGETYAVPKSRANASAEIERLLSRGRRRRERHYDSDNYTKWYV